VCYSNRYQCFELEAVEDRKPLRLRLQSPFISETVQDSLMVAVGNIDRKS